MLGFCRDCTPHVDGAPGKYLRPAAKRTATRRGPLRREMATWGGFGRPVVVRARMPFDALRCPRTRATRARCRYPPRSRVAFDGQGCGPVRWYAAPDGRARRGIRDPRRNREPLGRAERGHAARLVWATPVGEEERAWTTSDVSIALSGPPIPLGCSPSATACSRSS